jgi:hypothetical protein
VNYKLIIPKPISRALGQCNLSREALLWTINNLYQRLENDPSLFRSNRTVGKEEDSFTYEVHVLDGDRRHRLTFHVNDRMAPGLLLIEALVHRSQPEP